MFIKKSWNQNMIRNILYHNAFNSFYFIFPFYPLEKSLAELNTLWSMIELKSSHLYVTKNLVLYKSQPFTPLTNSIWSSPTLSLRMIKRMLSFLICLLLQDYFWLLQDWERIKNIIGKRQYWLYWNFVVGTFVCSWCSYDICLMIYLG